MYFLLLSHAQLIISSLNYHIQQVHKAMLHAIVQLNVIWHHVTVVFAHNFQRNVIHRSTHLIETKQKYYPATYVCILFGLVTQTCVIELSCDWFWSWLFTYLPQRQPTIWVIINKNTKKSWWKNFKIKTFLSQNKVTILYAMWFRRHFLLQMRFKLCSQDQEIMNSRSQERDVLWVVS